MTVLACIVTFIVSVGFGFLLGKFIKVGKKLDIVEIPSSEQGRKVVADILRERKNEITRMDTASAVAHGNTVLRSRRDGEPDDPNKTGY